MKKLALFILAVVALSDNLSAQMPSGPRYIENELYVRLKPEVIQDASVQYIPNPDNPNAAKSVWDVIKSYGGEKMQNTFPRLLTEMQDVFRVTVTPGSDIDKLIDVLNAHNDVEYAERIPYAYIQATQHIPAEPDMGKQWYFSAIHMTWGGYQRNGNVITIAVVDDGVRYTHEDLRNKTANGLGELNCELAGRPGVDDDGNGYVDDIIGWDVADNDNDPMSRPRPANLPNGQVPLFGCHGTHVAGIIAADDNSIGVTSLGINNQILCIKAVSNSVVKETEAFNLTHYCEGIAYALSRKVDIINCSWGTGVKSETLESLIKQAIKKDIIIVAAAGNYNETNDLYPAAFDGVIAVGATDPTDKKWSESNYGSYIDVMAPGKDIYSTIASGDQEYGYMSGTSMAAPIVSSLIGLILSRAPEWRPFVEKIIKETCDNIDAKNPDYIGRMGAGRINVDHSLNYSGDLTGIASVTQYSDFSVYPNPTASGFYIPFNTLSPNGQAVELVIYNSSGTEVARSMVGNPDEKVNVSQLPQGIYYISTGTAGSHYQSRLLIYR